MLSETEGGEAWGTRWCGVGFTVSCFQKGTFHKPRIFSGIDYVGETSLLEKSHSLCVCV